MFAWGSRVAPKNHRAKKSQHRRCRIHLQLSNLLKDTLRSTNHWARSSERNREHSEERVRYECVLGLCLLCACAWVCVSVVRGTRKWRHLFCRFVSLSGSRCHSRDYDYNDDDGHDEDDDEDSNEERAHDSNVKYKCGNWNFYSKQCPCCNRYVNNNKTHSHSQRQQLASNWAAHVRQASPDEPEQQRESERESRHQLCCSTPCMCPFPLCLLSFPCYTLTLATNCLGA